jgi:hypothetical protein
MPLMVLAFGMVLAGCTTNVATSKGTNFDKRTMGLIGIPKYTVLGPVTLEKDWSGILGFTTPTVGPLPSADFYFYQTGGVTYVDLLTKARELYEDADAVIDINIDYSASHYWIFYGKRTNIVSGIAIKYSRDEVSYPPPQDEVYILGTKK